jgi:hypothetical protein
MPRASGAVENFLRRWSTVDITGENALLFDEHLFGVRAIAGDAELGLLRGLSRHSPRAEFAARYKQILTTEKK